MICSFIMKWLHEGKSQDTLRYKHRGRYGISVNHFFIPLSWDWGRANSKHITISASICFSTSGPLHSTPSFFFLDHSRFWLFFTLLCIILSHLITLAFICFSTMGLCEAPILFSPGIISAFNLCERISSHFSDEREI